VRFAQHSLFRHPSFVLIVSTNDALNQVMPHHIAFVEVHEGETFYVLQDIRSFEETPDPRVKFLMEELVKSLHDFVRKTDLTFDEWGYAIDFLTRTGQKCTSTRQEFILLSDVLGVSMLVDAVNHRERDGATETTVPGP